MTVGAFDGMALIYDVVAKLNGKIDADKAMEVVKGWKTQSPRGPISIDSADARHRADDLRAPRREADGELWNVEFDKIDNVSDPGKQP